MKKSLLLCLLCIVFGSVVYGQSGVTPRNFLPLRDSLVHLSLRILNNPEELQRKNANYDFIKTLVTTLKLPNSYHFNLDTLKAIDILKSPDNSFKIFTWHVKNADGSYRYYGAIQMNTPGKLTLFPLQDFTPFIKSAKDTLLDGKHWYGARYSRIIPVHGRSPYFLLLGWKGNNDVSTKRVIEVISFNSGQPVFGGDVFSGAEKVKRVIFEYTHQASMLLKYISDENLIVFDHLAPPSPADANRPETYGPDLTYDGYKLKSGKWQYVKNLDMRNIATAQDGQEIADPKKQAISDRQQVGGE